VLLMPPNPEQAIRAVVAAIESGRLTRRRVEESVLRVLAAKIHVGLTPGKKLVDLEAISDVLDPPEADERAQQVADRAVTLVRNEGNVVPLANPDSSCLVVLVERRQSQYGQRIIDEVRKRAPQMRVAVLDASLPGAALADAAGDTARCHAIAVTTFVTASDTRNTVALGGDLGPFLEKLTAGPAPVVLVSLGSPYLLASFPKAAAYLATFSVASTSEIAAVKALFGEIPITGHLPVTIPGFARYGDGIQTPARTH